MLVPYFEGERTPQPARTPSASLHGLTIASTTRENLARAAHEGMLSGLGAGLDAVRAVGVRDRRLLLIGGAAHSTAVQTVAAQVFDSPVVVPAPGEYVAEGAAVQAAWVLRVSARTGRSRPSPSPTPITTLRSGSSTGATRPRWPRPPGRTGGGGVFRPGDGKRLPQRLLATHVFLSSLLRASDGRSSLSGQELLSRE